MTNTNPQRRRVSAPMTQGQLDQLKTERVEPAPATPAAEPVAPTKKRNTPSKASSTIECPKCGSETSVTPISKLFARHQYSAGSVEARLNPEMRVDEVSKLVRRDAAGWVFIGLALLSALIVKMDQSDKGVTIFFGFGFFIFFGIGAIRMQLVKKRLLNKADLVRAALAKGHYCSNDDLVFGVGKTGTPEMVKSYLFANL